MAVKIFPAIDLYDGKVVRLTQGDYAKKRQYSVTPIEAAKSFMDAGCENIHIVDLEGAEKGFPCHLDALCEIASLGMFTQYGGGLRSAEAVAAAVDSGAARVMAGSLIFRHIEAAGPLAERFGEKIMAAADIKNGKVAHSGWLQSSDIGPEEAVAQLAALGYKSFLVTLTEKDGMMQGTDPEFYKRLVRPGITIAAAGGITSEKDISALSAAGVNAVVIGKSLYEGGITIKGALKAAGE